MTPTPSAPTPTPGSSHTGRNADTRRSHAHCGSSRHSGIADERYRCTHHRFSRGDQATVLIQRKLALAGYVRYLDSESRKPSSQG